jgi:hypothetical protein
MIARLSLCCLCVFAVFGGCHLFVAKPVMLWVAAVPLPRAVDMPVIAGTRFDLPPLNGTASRERIWGWSKPREATNATRKEGTG